MDNLGIEPLPDIDFNIRAGNTLVGYANYDEVRNVLARKLDLDNAMETIAVRAADLQQTFDAFRQRQTEGGGSVPAEHKLALRHRVEALGDELNGHLAGQCGVKIDDEVGYTKWLKSHQPFHWFVEFCGIVSGGGFDAIIGNPPYVEYSRSGVGYRITATPITAKCDNLWTYVLERSIHLLKPTGRISLITPLSLFSSERFSPAYGLLTSVAKYATFLTLSGDAHPSVLFSDVKMSYTIFTCTKKQERDSEGQLYTSKLYRWFAAERANLFSLIEYHSALEPSSIGIPFKIGSALAASVVEKINAQRMTVARFERQNGVPMIYHRIVRHFVKALFTAPYFTNERDGAKRSEDYKLVFFEDDTTSRLIRSFLVSSTYYVFFVALSDAYHCGRDLVSAFPVGIERLTNEAKERLVAIGCSHERDLFRHSVRRRIRYKTTGWIEYDEFYPRESKQLTDKIDHILVNHYRFTEEELDFIVNYDIKYRMGRDTEGEDG